MARWVPRKAGIQLESRRRHFGGILALLVRILVVRLNGDEEAGPQDSRLRVAGMVSLRSAIRDGGCLGQPSGGIEGHHTVSRRIRNPGRGRHLLRHRALPEGARSLPVRYDHLLPVLVVRCFLSFDFFASQSSARDPVTSAPTSDLGSQCQARAACLRAHENCRTSRWVSRAQVRAVVTSLAWPIAHLSKKLIPP